MKIAVLPIIAYIDPGTGAMLFSVIMGIVSVLFFAIKGALVKIKFMISGGKVETSEDKIPLVIFAESKRYWNVFKPVCDALENRKFMCEYWTTSEDDPIFNEKYEYVRPIFTGEGNRAYAKLNLMNAYICLSTTPGLDVYQWKKSKNTECYIHMFHAIAESVLYRMFGIDYYDEILATGEVEEGYIRRIEKKRNLPQKKITVVGIPYMDVLLNRRLTAINETKNETVILLAPSWGINSIINKYGEYFIDSLINTGYKIIFRPHPQSFTSDPDIMAGLEKKYKDNSKFVWDRSADNFASLNEADVLISDFSGIIYDFALCFDKPVIYASSEFDFSPYDAWWLNGDSWQVNTLSCMGRELKEDEIDNIKDIIDDLLVNEKFKIMLEREKNIAWKNIGKSADIIADYITNRFSELTIS